MEFDKARVYSAVNADELKVGSKCIFADDLNSLHKKIQESKYHILKLIAIEKDCEIYRFKSQDYDKYALAYLIEEPKAQKEREYKPFSMLEKAKEIIAKHGGWVKDKKDNVQLLVVGFDDDNGVFLGNGYSCRYTGLFLDYVFANDDSPCGELVEE